MAEKTFIAARLADFPDWKEQPGAASSDRLIAISRELRLATSGTVVRSFSEVQDAFLSGAIVLVRSEELAADNPSLAPSSHSIGLLISAAPGSLTLWIPTDDGNSETITFSRADLDACRQTFALVLTQGA